MKVSVWDTYVPRLDGKIMHFDILVPNALSDIKTIFCFGTEFLKEKPFKTEKITVNECRFCHIACASDEIVKSIHAKGYHIIELENCH